MPKKISEKDIFKTNFFTIKDVDLKYDDNQIKTHQIIQKPNVSIIVPLMENGSLILIKEYHTAHDQYDLDLPGGKIDPGYSPEETADKELQEEIGYKAGKLSKLGVLTISPGYVTQISHVFLATGLTPSKLEGDETEPLEVIEFPFENFEELIEKGELREARAITALYLARNFLRRT